MLSSGFGHDDEEWYCMPGDHWLPGHFIFFNLKCKQRQ